MPATIGFTPRHAQPFTLEQAMLLEIEVLIAGELCPGLVWSGLVYSSFLVSFISSCWSYCLLCVVPTLSHLRVSVFSPGAFPFLPSDACLSDVGSSRH